MERERRTTWRSPGSPTGPAARPSPSPLPLLSSSSCQWEQLRARTRAAEEASSSLPGCLLLPRDVSRSATPPPGPLSLPPVLLPPLLCSLPRHTRAHPTPPFAATTATGHPTPHRRAQKLCHFVLYLLNEPRGPGRAATPPSMSSSTSGPPAIFVKFVGSGPSPTSPSVPSSSP